jgi:hypothetical protein
LGPLVARRARRLDEPGGQEPDRRATHRDQPRLPTREAFDIVHHPVGVRLAQIAPQTFHALSDQIGVPGNAVISVLSQLLGDLADRVRRRRDLLAGLGRPYVQFLPDALASLTSHLLSLLADLLSRLLDALLRLLARGLLGADSAACGGLFHIRHEPLLG